MGLTKEIVAKALLTLIWLARFLRIFELN